MFIKISDIVWTTQALRVSSSQGVLLPSDIVMEIADDLLPVGNDDEMDETIAAHLIADCFLTIEDIEYLDSYEWQYGAIINPQSWFDTSSRMVGGEQSTPDDIAGFLAFEV